jgi:DNA repair ATPase RecN
VTVEELVLAVERLHGQRDAIQQRRRALAADVEALAAETILLTVTKSALEHLLSRVNAENLERVEQLVTYGLSVVFPDRHLTLKAVATTKRGAPWITLKLKSGDTEAPILDAFGGGPASVVAFLLRVLALQRSGLAPLIVLDETFSHVSEGYVDAVGELLRELADHSEVTILLVTHQPAFLAHATRAYEITDGGVEGSVFRAVGRP